MAVHLRRGDFINRKTSVSIKHASLQVKNILTKLDIDTVYLATDGTQKGITYLIYNIPPLILGLEILNMLSLRNRRIQVTLDPI